MKVPELWAIWGALHPVTPGTHVRCGHSEPLLRACEHWPEASREPAFAHCWLHPEAWWASGDAEMAPSLQGDYFGLPAYRDEVSPRYYFPTKCFTLTEANVKSPYVLARTEPTAPSPAQEVPSIRGVLEEASALPAIAVCDHSRHTVRWCSPSPRSPGSKTEPAPPSEGSRHSACDLGPCLSGLGASPQVCRHRVGQVVAGPAGALLS